MLRQLLGAKDFFDVPQRRLEDFWSIVDRDGSGNITFPEFVAFYVKFFTRQSEGGVGRKERQMTLLDSVGPVGPWNESRLDEFLQMEKPRQQQLVETYLAVEALKLKRNPGLTRKRFGR
mmetsp:Transcript_48220/g.109312  ORF Transcript_48220/g.109312 Transcript_48220/m.109312 type:complete len:119 (+) Transcript_48220:423-779(+)